MIWLFAALCILLGACLCWLVSDMRSAIKYRKLLRELTALHRKADHMANELANLQTAAAAIIAKLNELAQAQGVPPADVQAVADQLTAAVTAASAPPP